MPWDGGKGDVTAITEGRIGCRSSWFQKKKKNKRKPSGGKEGGSKKNTPGKRHPYGRGLLHWFGREMGKKKNTSYAKGKRRFHNAKPRIYKVNLRKLGERPRGYLQKKKRNSDDKRGKKDGKIQRGEPASPSPGRIA